MSDRRPPPETATRPLRVFLVAGEHSGDRLGAGLMRAIRSLRPDARFEGLGGDGMIAEGLVPIFPLSDIAVMGFVPVLARLPTLVRRLDDTVRAVLTSEADALVIIDSPDFTHRVARRVRRRRPSMVIVDYVSPTVWAWRPGRARAMRAYVDHVLALLPFETEAHLRLGGPPCTYVGHPLVESLGVLRPDEKEERVRDTPTLLVLPGSRRSEIRRLDAVFGETVARVAARTELADVVLPAVEDLFDEVSERVARWAVRPTVVRGAAAKYGAFRRARAALAASGTVTLELALSGVPMVVGYKVSPLEVWLKYVIDVPSIVLPNLVLGRNAIPEFIQGDCTPEHLADALLPLIGTGPERQAQLSALADVGRRMATETGQPPSREAAQVVVDVLQTLRSKT